MNARKRLPFRKINQDHAAVIVSRKLGVALEYIEIWFYIKIPF